MRIIVILLCAFGDSLNFLQRGETKTVKYWNDPRIHNFGNIGFFGRIHAELCPFFTRFIDEKAYNGRDIRLESLNNTFKEIFSNNEKRLFCVDLCCGTGYSTKSILEQSKKYSLNENRIIGIDTSPEMIHVGKRVNGCENTRYFISNAETFGFSDSFDVVTIMYAFHEIPQDGRIKILKNIKRILKKNGKCVIVDIATNYCPSEMMLSGEPFVEEYLINIDDDINSIFPSHKKSIVVEGHVHVWEI